MPQFGAFEVGVEHVCLFPWCPSSRWELGCCGEVWPTVSPTWLTCLPGGPGMWCQRQVPGGHHLNNASCPALALAGAPLWSAPETSVAWVFNHLACTSLLSINPSPLLHSPLSLSSLFSATKLMRSLRSLCLSLCVCCAHVVVCLCARLGAWSHSAAKFNQQDKQNSQRLLVFWMLVEYSTRKGIIGVLSCSITFAKTSLSKIIFKCIFSQKSVC